MLALVVLEELFADDAGADAPDERLVAALNALERPEATPPLDADDAELLKEATVLPAAAEPVTEVRPLPLRLPRREGAVIE